MPGLRIGKQTFQMFLGLFQFWQKEKVLGRIRSHSTDLLQMSLCSSLILLIQFQSLSTTHHFMPIAHLQLTNEFENKASHQHSVYKPH